MSTDSSKNSDPKGSKRQKLRDELQFLGQMSSTETALFHQKAADRYGMGITEMKALSTLMQEGNMTAGQLAERLSLTTGAVTNLLDRLEKKGIIERKADPKDRRKVIATVKFDASDKPDNIYDSIGKAFDKQLESYSEKELEFLVNYYRQAIELTKQEIAKLSEK